MAREAPMLPPPSLHKSQIKQKDPSFVLGGLRQGGQLTTHQLYEKLSVLVMAFDHPYDGLVLSLNKSRDTLGNFFASLFVDFWNQNDHRVSKKSQNAK
jgi:hypothetical protein